MSDDPWRLDESAKDHRHPSTAPNRTMADLLFLPEAERSLMNWLLRKKQATLSEIAAHFNQPEPTIIDLLNHLLIQGFVKQIDQENACYYQPNLLSRKGRNVPANLWDALE